MLLLCKLHHKLIDDHPEVYTVERVRELKKVHEEWVQASLRQRDECGSPEQHPSTSLSRISNGKQLASIVAYACAYHLDHDDLETQEEVEVVTSIAEMATDWGDLWSQMSPGDRIRTQHEMNAELQRLEEQGLLLFGLREHKTIRINGKDVDWPVATIRFVRQGPVVPRKRTAP